MQRVLHEILRRSFVNTEHSTKKRKATSNTREDGMFAETQFTRESRGARPGTTTFGKVKRRRLDSAESGKMYGSQAMYR
jgi:hypothetical protein